MLRNKNQMMVSNNQVRKLVPANEVKYPTFNRAHNSVQGVNKNQHQTEPPKQLPQPPNEAMNGDIIFQNNGRQILNKQSNEILKGQKFSNVF